MRPGQTAPECGSARTDSGFGQKSFNEAGADCPGMRQDLQHSLHSVSRFNEAGADCPGMQAEIDRVIAEGVRSFNEAGADCPGMHKGCRFQHGRLRCFNEAGADCPGMRRGGWSGFRPEEALQ